MGNPTGTVEFEVSGTAIATCSAVALAAGTATCMTTLPVGTSSVTAAYSGDQVFPSSLGTVVVTVVEAPGVPSNVGVTLTPSDGGATGSGVVSWTPPSNGSGVTYTVMAEPSGQSCSTTGTSCTIAGLKPGVPYSFVVNATNMAGTSGPADGATISPTLFPDKVAKALSAHMVPVEVSCHIAECLGVANVTVARRVYKNGRQIGWEHLVLAQGSFELAANQTLVIDLAETSIGRALLPSQTKWWLARDPMFRMTLSAALVGGSVDHAPAFIRALHSS
jgi:hypothetical protein